MKIAIIGYNAYLAHDIEKVFTNATLFKRFESVSDVDVLKSFDYVINFSIQPAFKQEKLRLSDIIDVKIANVIKDSDTKFVMISSRKVYGASDRFALYSEQSELRPTDCYSYNKIISEREIQRILPNKNLILRVGNILDFPTDKNNSTFISWISGALKNNGVLNVTENENVRKDFITRDYFQSALKTLIDKQKVGIFNIGAGFALKIKDLLPMITGQDRIVFQNTVPEKDGFILDCDKLHAVVMPFTKQELYAKCRSINQIYQK